MAYIYYKIKEALKEKVRFYECVSTRYELSYCLLLIYTECEDDISTVVMANTRCADSFLKIKDNTYALLFFANKPDSYDKVANKILHILEKSYPTCKFSIGVACKEHDEEDIITRAIQNLLSAKKLEGNTIVDEF
jgi:GGDEF domain-containing protein